MAQRVVHRFEVVEVDHEESAALAAFDKRRCHIFLERGMVQQLGHRIKLGAALHSLGILQSGVRLLGSRFR